MIILFALMMAVVPLQDGSITLDGRQVLRFKHLTRPNIRLFAFFFYSLAPLNLSSPY